MDADWTRALREFEGWLWTEHKNDKLEELDLPALDEKARELGCLPDKAGMYRFNPKMLEFEGRYGTREAIIIQHSGEGYHMWEFTLYVVPE